MAFELKQNLKLSQQLIMTPQLQQAIKLLQLSRLELVDTINQEMEENPLLEETSPDEGNEEEIHPEIEDDVQSIEREETKAVERADELTGEGVWGQTTARNPPVMNSSRRRPWYPLKTGCGSQSDLATGSGIPC